MLLSIAVGAGQPAAHGDRFVLVRRGCFQMGDLWGDGPFAMREVPVHEDGFLLSRFAVTVSEFARFAEGTGYRPVTEADAGLHPRQTIVRFTKTIRSQ